VTLPQKNDYGNLAKETVARDEIIAVGSGAISGFIGARQCETSGEAVSIARPAACTSATLLK
jgi:hypothetical protein